MPELEIPQEPSEVSESWQQMVQAILACALLLVTLAMLHYYVPAAVQGAPPNDLQQQVHELTAQVDQLRRQQDMPAMVLNCRSSTVATDDAMVSGLAPGTNAVIATWENPRSANR